MHSRLIGRATRVSLLIFGFSALAHAQCPNPDSFEPNNDCASAVVLTAGSYTGLTCHGSGSGADDPDFFKIDVQSGDRLNAQIHHTYAEAEDLDLYIYDAADPGCGNRMSFLAQSYHSANNEFATWTNTTGATVTCIIEVAAWAFSETPTDCDEYDLVIETGPHACIGATDDAFEDNDTCATATPVAAGIYTGLIVRDPDQDMYQTIVQPNDRVVVDLFYGIDGPFQELQLTLYADALCQSWIGTESGEGSNSLSWSNATANPVTVSFAVAGFGQLSCNEYSIQVSTAPDPCLLAVDDVFEPNDVCSGAATITTGSWTDLFVSKSQPDHYAITLQPLDRLVVESSYFRGDGDLRLELATDPNCLTVVDAAGMNGVDHVEYGNNTGAPINMRIAVSMPTFVQQDCNTYDLDVSVVLDPCLQLPDDSYEPNDDCAASVALVGGHYAGLFLVENDPDYFSVVVQNGEQLSARIDYSPIGGGLELSVMDAPFCNQQLTSASSSGSDLVTWTNSTGVAQTYHLVVDVPAFATTTCKDYDLDISIVPDPCLVTLDDALEDNDACGSAVALPTGVTQNLFVSGSDEDYYTVNVPAGNRLSIDVSYDAQSHPLLITLFSDPSCTSLIDQQGWSGTESFSWSNTGGIQATLALSVVTDSGAPGTCNSYDLNVAIVPDPCLSVPDDAYEENDNCFSATPVSTSTLANLFCSSSDPDNFSFTLDNGGAVEIHARHIAANGDLDLKLFDAPFNCFNPFGSIAVGATGLDDEVLFFSNNSGSTQTYYLNVAPWESGACNSYSLTVLIEGDPLAHRTCVGDGTFNAGSGLIGCPCGNQSNLGSEEGCLNSQGHGAILNVSGSVFHAEDDAVFTVTQARPSQPSILLQGTSLTGLTFKDGILCMGNPTERVEVVFLNGGGSGSTQGSIVTQGHVAGPGLTRYYQQWYRDPALSTCGTGSNLSSGLMINWL